MRSVLRSAKKGKKVRKLGEVEVIEREQYEDLAMDTKVELIRSLVPLGGISDSDCILGDRPGIQRVR
jgi:hypothetical protein